jgi:hypothetical protein
LTSFRKIMIEHSLATGDLDAAEALAKEGMKLAEKGQRYGLVWEFRRHLLSIAQQRSDYPALVEHARALWLNRGGETYYDLMANTVPADQWVAFREPMLSDKECPRELAVWAYAREGLWTKVRDIVFDQPLLLAPYQLEIEARFPDETAKLYARFARAMLKDVTNRQTYQQAAGYLVRMQKLGHGDEAKTIARSFIEQYPQRRAMIEELRRVL